MSGLEAIGFVLAIFPVAVAAVTAYRGKLTDDDLRFLDRSLENQRTIFINAAEELLCPVVPREKLPILFGDPKGEMWRDREIENKLRSHLGEETSQLFKTAQRIGETIRELQKHLPVS